MRKEGITGMLKGITTGVLGLSIVCLFLPYAYDINLFELIKQLFEALFNGMDFADMAEAFFYVVAPVCLLLVAAVISLGSFSVAKSGIVAVLSAVAAIANFTFMDKIGNYGGAARGIGLILQVIIAIAGVILPIANIVMTKRNDSASTPSV